MHKTKIDYYKASKIKPVIKILGKNVCKVDTRQTSDGMVIQRWGNITEIALSLVATWLIFEGKGTESRAWEADHNWGVV